MTNNLETTNDLTVLTTNSICNRPITNVTRIRLLCNPTRMTTTDYANDDGSSCKRLVHKQYLYCQRYTILGMEIVCVLFYGFFFKFNVSTYLYTIFVHSIQNDVGHYEIDTVWREWYIDTCINKIQLLCVKKKFCVRMYYHR